mgnify:CR=1 FL=1
MNILYINGHPYEKSFHSTIQETFVSSVSDANTLKVLELGKAAFDPILRYGYAKRMPKDAFIEQSKELVAWADHIVFAFPIWWGDAPALLRGWIDRVFTPGDTYKFNGFNIDKKLKGKTADLIVTSRALRPIFWVIGVFGVSLFIRNLFLVTGIKKKAVITLGGVGLIPKTDTEARRDAFLRRVARRASRL